MNKNNNAEMIAALLLMIISAFATIMSFTFAKTAIGVILIVLFAGGAVACGFWLMKIDDRRVPMPKPQTAQPPENPEMAAKPYNVNKDHIVEVHIIGQSANKNTKDAINRAIIGGVLVGGAGAIVGASTGANDEIITFLIDYDDGSRAADRVLFGSERYNWYIKYLKFN